MNFFVNPVLYPIFIISLLSVAVTHCAAQKDPLPIEERTELPVYPGEIESGNLSFPVIFQINEDGSVADVQLLSSSGNQEWDRMAADSLRKWKFDPPSSNENEVLVRRNIQVKFLTPEVRNLGILIANNEEEANVLYNRLRAGISFEGLVRQAPDSSNPGKGGRFIENASTADFPNHISKILVDLNVGNVTRPVLLDGEYVIFKRYGDQLPEP